MWVQYRGNLQVPPTPARTVDAQTEEKSWSEEKYDSWNPEVERIFFGLDGLIPNTILAVILSPHFWEYVLEGILSFPFSIALVEYSKSLSDT